MNIRFETCERSRALSFLQKLYPSKVIVDSPESAGPVLDLVEKDIFRIPDPQFHSGAVYPSKNWNQQTHLALAKAAIKTLESSPVKVAS